MTPTELVLTATALSNVPSLIGLQYLYMYEDCIEFEWILLLCLLIHVL